MGLCSQCIADTMICIFLGFVRFGRHNYYKSCVQHREVYFEKKRCSFAPCPVQKYFFCLLPPGTAVKLWPVANRNCVIAARSPAVDTNVSRTFTSEAAAVARVLCVAFNDIISTPAVLLDH